MSTPLKKLLFLILFCIVSQPQAAEIRGRIILCDTGEIIPIVYVELDSNRGVYPNWESGYFSFINVQPGIHILSGRLMGWKEIRETITIESDTEIFDKDFILEDEREILEEFPECEQYHQQLQEIAKHQDVFEIKIKKKIRNNALFLQIALKNKTGLPLYIAEPGDCWQYFFVSAYNGKGDSMECNFASLASDCILNPQYPDSSNLVIIPPHSSVDYPEIEAFPYCFMDYPKDTYTINIKYYNKRPEFMKLKPHSRKDSREDLSECKKVLSILLRGEYRSSNSVNFNNTKQVNAYLKWEKKQK